MGKVITEKGGKGFLMWVRANQPRLYAEFLRHYNTQSVSGLGMGATDDPLTPSFVYSMSDPAQTAAPAPPTPSWVDSVTNLFKAAGQAFLTKTQVDAQGKLLDTQLARARAGLPPLNIDPSSYGLQPTVGVGLTSSTQSLLMYGGLAALGVWLLTSLSKHRRR